MRITTTYERIIFQARKSFKCTVCGKRGVRSTTFGQTVNPFNKNADGLPKTVGQIQRELAAKAQAWQPTMHARCEQLEKYAASSP